MSLELSTDSTTYSKVRSSILCIPSIHYVLRTCTSNARQRKSPICPGEVVDCIIRIICTYLLLMYSVISIVCMFDASPLMESTVQGLDTYGG